MDKSAIIIGAGPAGLTAALELLKKTDIKPVIYEQSNIAGGISSTFEYKGNRMDMGGHRFFSKSDAVMDFWNSLLPMQGAPSKDDLILERKIELSTVDHAPDPEKEDDVMLVRNRLSRIFYLKKFFDYPVTLNMQTITNLGFFKMVKIGVTYFQSLLFKIKDEKSLQDFMVNRFGSELYKTFFRDYTYKLWGVDPSEIPADWGSQRIKGVSITKVLIHALKSVFNKKGGYGKKVETSLIDHFYYPKYGPGQLWETAAKEIISLGGEIHYNSKVQGIIKEGHSVKGVKITDESGSEKTVSGDYFFSTMPVRELTLSMNDVPDEVAEVAQGLLYRDFITVGLLLKKLKIKNATSIKTVSNIVPDNWIYIQERDVKIGRLQIFNNWSPYMVKDLEDTVFIGLEYFCNEGDELWEMAESDFKAFAIDELAKIGIIEKQDVLDSCLVKVPKAYPAYFGTYDRFEVIKDYFNKIDNLYLVGRNGMHRYNNMDHSMLTAMAAVSNISSGRADKENIWQVNAEDEYHEEKK